MKSNLSVTFAATIPALFACVTVLSFLGATGCSDNPQACTVSSDCFSGESCVAGRCRPQSGADGGDDISDADAFDAGDSGQDTGGSEDSGGEDSGGEDSGGGGETCAVDPFTATCNNDDEYDNDEWSDADEFKDTSLGCYGSLDRPEDWSTVINGTMCYDEESDYFGMNIVPCDSQYKFQVKLSVPAMCTAREWGLDVRVGTSISCETGLDDSYRSMQCVRDGNTETWTIIVKNSNSVWPFTVGVIGALEGESQFNYTLEGRVL